MHVGVMELHFVLWASGSLKDKRSVIRRIMARCRSKFNLAVAEVDEQDAIDRAVLAVVTVGNGSDHVRRMLDNVEQFIERLALAELLEAPKSVERY